VINWYQQSGRKNLPWQKNPTPYRVWISEIMLQQTQVKTVIPYYLKFMKQLPELKDLAVATDEQVMALWSGLGYYSRARNLHKTALLLVERQGLSSRVSLPDTLEELIDLPGIGRSTAGAILSLAMNKKAAILDGNVKRVLARCFKVAGWPGESAVQKKLWDLAEQLLPDNEFKSYTQAIMDLGATICTSTNPLCTTCPLENYCLSREDGDQTDYPGKKKKKTMPVKEQYFYLLLSNDDQEILLEKRPPTGIWGGLWTPPSCNTDQDGDDYLMETFAIKLKDRIKLPGFRHTFSHFHLQLQPIKAHCIPSDRISEANLRWDSIDNWLESGIPAAVRTLLISLKKENL